jgi:diguanylate cyclase (GGDEF)-like protein/PAS domain S-box-containing protein
VTLNQNNHPNIVTSFSRPFSDVRAWLVPVVISLFLIFVSTKNFLLFHTLVELFAIVVAIILSVVAWHTYSFSKNHFLMFLGTGYFWVAILDLMHTLSYPDLNLVDAVTINSTTQYWISARYSEAILLLVSPFYLTRSVKSLYVTSFFGAGCLISYLLVTYGLFPETFIEGQGLTTFKVTSEYIIILLLVLAIVNLVRKRRELDKRICTLIVLSVLFTITSELIFTLYTSMTAVEIIAGHISKLFSFWFIFIAIVRSTLTEPYQVMARGSSTYDAIPTPTIVVDKNCHILQVNKSACLDVDEKRNRLIGQHCHNIFHPNYLTVEECPVCQHIKSEQTLDSYVMEFRKTKVWREFTLTPYQMIGDIEGIVHVSPDVTRRKQDQDKLIYQAKFDQLTGFPNRVLATDRLEMAIKHAERDNISVAIMFIDIDNFKNINDSLGHIFGDKVIIEISKRIAENLRDSDTMARWGGDEFLIILPELNSISESEKVAEKILGKLSKPIIMECKEFVITVSIGIAGYPNDGDNVNSLLSHADAAMYDAKNSGKNTYKLFNKVLNDSAERHMILENHLRHAIDRNEFSLHYQPMFDLTTKKIVGCEALLRWNNDLLGQIEPDKFIHLAEKNGQIISIGEWVFETACKEISKWNKLGFTDLYVAINICSTQTEESGFVNRLKTIVSENDINASNVILEITENVLLSDEFRTIDLLTELSEFGFQLSLDDFGTGYSSLSYLKKFPFDEIKIDRSFVRDIATDPSDAALCQAIISMADSLNLRVVGEGVEDIEQLNFLTDNKVDKVQGFYFSKALDSTRFIEYIKESA